MRNVFCLMAANVQIDRRKESSDENNSESDAEEGEIEAGTSTHPMVSLSKIDPKDIPEVSNKFLMRAGRRSQDNEEAPKERTDRDDSDGRRRDRRRDDDRRDNKKYVELIYSVSDDV